MNKLEMGIVFVNNGAVVKKFGEPGTNDLDRSEERFFTERFIFYNS